MESVPIKWRRQRHRYMLTGSKCSCGGVFYPPRNLCSCGKNTEDAVLSGEGKIISYTEIHTAPEGFEAETPYTIALIKLKDGPVIPAHIVGRGAEIGKKVAPVFRKMGEGGKKGVIAYTTKFVVV
ncbi:MAG: Zn-ribbon domain-containing OB-fold protein [Candidatus Aenigmarchaeota archaeon]|nr:Zn-ribbon domain-containing OB-fold protein [Candidatus Aenigmarchaeota archaeon]